MHPLFSWGNLRDRDHLEDPGVDGGDNIKMDHREMVLMAWNGLFWLRIGAGADCCECGNESLGSIKCGEFLDQLW